MRRPRRAPALVLAAGALVALAAVPATAAKDDLDLVSRASGVGGAAGDDESESAAISADGRFVAFQSGADNLSSEDDNAFTNVFVRDLETNTTTLVSRRSDIFVVSEADGDSASPSISADGRYVAFQSEANNLSADDDDSVGNIFVRDRQAGTTTLVSREDGAAGAGGDGISFGPSISADGRHVAFGSFADNLSIEANDVINIFIRDLDAHDTTLVSRVTGLSFSATDDSFRPSVSADGRFVAFDSHADNLSLGDDNDFLNLFMRDVQTNTTSLVGRGSGAISAAPNEDSFDGSISADGSRVAFVSRATNLSVGDDDSASDIFVRNLDTGITSLVSRATGSAGPGGGQDSFQPSISADGTRVAFGSSADNLSADDVDGQEDVFVRDLVAGTTTFVSRAPGPDAAGADKDAVSPSVSAEGRFVAFSSRADNLSAEDPINLRDVFRRDVLGPPPPPPPGPSPGPVPPPAPPPPAGLPPAPGAASPTCNPVPERGESKKGTIRYTRTALKIQQNIDSAVIRRLNAANVWMDAGIVPTDLCAGAFGPGAFQAGISWAGGASHAATPPTPRDIQIIKRPGTGVITRSIRQLEINENISRALRARAVATVKRIDALTGGNLAPGAVLSGRAVWPGLMAVGPKPPSADAPPAELEIGRLPRKIPIRPNAITVKKQQERSQGSIILANRALDAITGGLTEENFVPGSIGAGRI